MNPFKATAAVSPRCCSCTQLALLNPSVPVHSSSCCFTTLLLLALWLLLSAAACTATVTAAAADHSLCFQRTLSLFSVVAMLHQDHNRALFILNHSKSLLNHTLETQQTIVFTVNSGLHFKRTNFTFTEPHHLVFRDNSSVNARRFHSAAGGARLTLQHAQAASRNSCSSFKIN